MSVIKLFLIFFMLSPCIVFAQHAVNIEDMSVICNHVQDRKTPAGADYVPNIDVKGNSVTSANISDSANNTFLNNPIRIPIALNLIEKFTLDLPEGVFSEPVLSTIDIHQNGTVTYNGQNITKSVKQTCLQQNSAPSEIITPTQKPNKKARQRSGQNNEIPVPSADRNNDKINGKYP